MTYQEGNKKFFSKIEIFSIIFGMIIIFFPFGNKFLGNFSEENRYANLKIGEKNILVEVFDDSQERVKGLSGRKELKKDEGAFFIFEIPDFYGIWMKEMNFPIDIAWIDKDFKIVYIENNISPETFPKIFYPTQKSLYVLEIGAGFLQKNEIKVGDSVKFLKK